MTLPRTLLITLALCAGFLAAPVSAQAINGQYDAYSCPTDSFSIATLTIAWPTLTFYESSCTITESVAGAENTYVMQCSGEGEYWTSQIRITPQVGGNLVLNSRGSDTLYQRCS